MGDSESGKSHFMKAYVRSVLKLNPLVINDVNSLTHFSPGRHTCIIFDDCNFENFNREFMIKLLDSQDETTFRLTQGSYMVLASIPRFFISNKPLNFYLKFDLDKAITRRYVHYDLGSWCLFSMNLTDNQQSA